eukprot:CAMPEP_0182443698 /NCGR_PEP_ID=MMETSP1172-20130603/2361_1 /TAXON_ID=708627 /ORGANISM="Timspurckia oligopyrenoides, Strain CCMP3278" /LENGTH=325 /DNA_ID=CAMNT_0024639055 /DNA_START=154 /DNA_END=1131 /DNA_ORIENTATION=+
MVDVPNLSLARVDSKSYTRRKRDAWGAEDLSRLPVELHPKEDETLDLILRRKILLLQSRRGYRANTDSQVLGFFAQQCFRTYAQQLAISDASPSHILDLGAANGLVSLLLAKSFPSAHIYLLEIQKSLCERAKRNMALNGIAPENFSVYESDLAQGIPGSTKYDLIVSNPPYYIGKTHRVPPRNYEKLIAHLESSASLSKFALEMKNALNPTRFSLGCWIQDYTEKDRLLDAIQDAGLEILRVCHLFHASIDPAPIRVLVSVCLPELRSKLSARSVHAVEDIILHPGSDVNSTTYDDEHESWMAKFPIPPFIIGRLRPDFQEPAD